MSLMNTRETTTRHRVQDKNVKDIFIQPANVLQIVQTLNMTMSLIVNGFYLPNR